MPRNLEKCYFFEVQKEFFFPNLKKNLKKKTHKKLEFPFFFFFFLGKKVKDYFSYSFNCMQTISHFFISRDPSTTPRVLVKSFCLVLSIIFSCCYIIQGRWDGVELLLRGSGAIETKQKISMQLGLVKVFWHVKKEKKLWEFGNKREKVVFKPLERDIFKFPIYGS